MCNTRCKSCFDGGSGWVYLPDLRTLQTAWSRCQPFSPQRQHTAAVVFSCCTEHFYVITHADRLHARQSPIASCTCSQLTHALRVQFCVLIIGNAARA
jgi:hypothetical protein